MSFFASLKALVAVQSQPFSAISDDGDDYIKPPSGSIFYERLPMPEGPGVEQIKMIADILPPMDLKKGPWIAGGAARRLLQGESLEKGDIDLFFKDFKSWKHFCDTLEGYELVIKTQRATTFLVHGFKVQCIKRQFYATLEEVFKDFDFSVCQVATDGFELGATKQAHLDVTDQVLRFAPGGKIAKHTLVQRLSKYVNHGMLPEPGLFELVVKSGLDYTSAYSIFSDTEAAIYDENEGAVVEEMIPTESLDDGVLRTIARQLGLEKTDV